MTWQFGGDSKAFGNSWGQHQLQQEILAYHPIDSLFAVDIPICSTMWLLKKISKPFQLFHATTPLLLNCAEIFQTSVS